MSVTLHYVNGRIGELAASLRNKAREAYEAPGLSPDQFILRMTRREVLYEARELELLNEIQRAATSKTKPLEKLQHLLRSYTMSLQYLSDMGSTCPVSRAKAEIRLSVIGDILREQTIEQIIEEMEKA